MLAHKLRRAAGAGVTPPVLSYISQQGSTSDLTVYTFAGVTLGAGHIIVGVSANAGTTGATISSVTVDGVTATQVDQGNNGTFTAGLFIAPCSSATGDIVVTFSVGKGRAHIGWWKATGLNSMTPTSQGTSTADPGSVTLTTNTNGGFAIGYGANVDGGSSTWTNASERFDAVVEAVLQASGADAATTGASLNIQDNYAGTDARRLLCAAAWF